jgi:flagellar hook-associated protein 1 FlgK
MSGLFDVFNVAKRGMAAQQTALNVTSHNIANADTDGYSVQRANIKTTEPFGMPSIYTAGQVGQMGTGAEVASIDRSRDTFLDTQIRNEDSIYGQYGIREQFLSDVEAVLNDTSKTGLASVMDNFWDSWQQLSTNPEPDSTARTLVLQDANALTTAINQDYDKLQSFETNAGGLIQQQVFEVNSTLTQISDLNDQIKAVKVGGETPNDLYDKRDLLLDQLSQRFGFDVKNDEASSEDLGQIYINAKVENTNPDGTVSTVEKDLSPSSGTGVISFLDVTNNGGSYTANIYVGGDSNNVIHINNLSKDDLSNYANFNSKGDITSYKLQTVFYNKSSSFDSVNSTDSLNSIAPANFASGSLNGLTTISTEIEDYKNDLNNLAKVLAVSVNTIHSGTIDSSDKTAVNFFNVDAETSDDAAKDISVAVDKADDINAGAIIGSESTGNGERATMIGQLRNTVMDVLGIADTVSPANIRKTFADNVLKDSNGNTITNLNDISNIKLQSASSGESLNSYYKSTVTKLGVSSQEAVRMVTNENTMLSQLESKRDSVSGVSLDEEITNMIQFQRSYEANAKMINVVDELLDTVVNGLIK